MTAAEAVSLVLKADLMAGAGEVFWLDMGEPVRIGDLVDRMMTLEEPPAFARACQDHRPAPGREAARGADDAGPDDVPDQHRRIWVATQVPANLAQFVARSGACACGWRITTRPERWRGSPPPCLSSW